MLEKNRDNGFSVVGWWRADWVWMWTHEPSDVFILMFWLWPGNAGPDTQLVCLRRENSSVLWAWVIIQGLILRLTIVKESRCCNLCILSGYESAQGKVWNEGPISCSWQAVSFFLSVYLINLLREKPSGNYWESKHLISQKIYLSQWLRPKFKLERNKSYLC